MLKDEDASPSAAPDYNTMRQTLTALVEIAIALDRAQDSIDRLVDDLDARGLLPNNQKGAMQHRGRHRAA